MKKVKPVTLFLRATDENRPEELRLERREGAKERRRLYTYIADDRRSGIADRRKRLRISLVFDGNFYSEVVKRAISSNY